MKRNWIIKIMIIVAFMGVLSAYDEEEIQQMVIKQFLNRSSEELFQVYHTIFKKTYSLESEEGLQRKQNFIENLNFMKQNAEFSNLKINFTTDLPHFIWKSLITENSYSQTQNVRIKGDFGKCFEAQPYKYNYKTYYNLVLNTCNSSSGNQLFTLENAYVDFVKYMKNNVSGLYISIEGYNPNYSLGLNSLNSNRAVRLNTRMGNIISDDTFCVKDGKFVAFYGDNRKCSSFSTY
jgi:hypothetical protein